jgi:hypothetical protein
MEADELARQRAVRDERLTPLFRRWPALTRPELRELKTLHVERLRIAKYFGRLRARRAAS